MTVKRKLVCANAYQREYRYGYWVVTVYDTGEAEWRWIGNDVMWRVHLLLREGK